MSTATMYPSSLAGLLNSVNYDLAVLGYTSIPSESLLAPSTTMTETALLIIRDLIQTLRAAVHSAEEIEDRTVRLQNDYSVLQKRLERFKRDAEHNLQKTRALELAIEKAETKAKQETERSKYLESELKRARRNEVSTGLRAASMTTPLKSRSSHASPPPPPPSLDTIQGLCSRCVALAKKSGMPSPVTPSAWAAPPSVSHRRADTSPRRSPPARQSHSQKPRSTPHHHDDWTHSESIETSDNDSSSSSSESSDDDGRHRLIRFADTHEPPVRRDMGYRPPKEPRRSSLKKPTLLERQSSRESDPMQLDHAGARSTRPLSSPRSPSSPSLPGSVIVSSNLAQPHLAPAQPHPDHAPAAAAAAAAAVDSHQAHHQLANIDTNHRDAAASPVPLQMLPTQVTSPSPLDFGAASGVAVSASDSTAGPILQPESIPSDNFASTNAFRPTEPCASVRPPPPLDETEMAETHALPNANSSAKLRPLSWQEPPSQEPDSASSGYPLRRRSFPSRTLQRSKSEPLLKVIPESAELRESVIEEISLTSAPWTELFGQKVVLRKTGINLLDSRTDNESYRRVSSPPLLLPAASPLDQSPETSARARRSSSPAPFQEEHSSSMIDFNSFDDGPDVFEKLIESPGSRDILADLSQADDASASASATLSMHADQTMSLDMDEPPVALSKNEVHYAHSEYGIPSPPLSQTHDQSFVDAASFNPSYLTGDDEVDREYIGNMLSKLELTTEEREAMIEAVLLNPSLLEKLM
ncbi:uncharacterized protein BJ171DRAFT_585163 [Polychytrium aggregatum]|uniref:uncharacterized protein n=1 Tax=Polychytrium aggregatum TaxID=110093 RepID=UPI0022FE77E8|nr:uncharacterized protein BJ171DRAFT_585163 [Polychytrium aggregatum]KAI9199616.1 hypothetical protein BJ171DRAFT_585163 [Polychytrium aggregatum]